MPNIPYEKVIYEPLKLAYLAGIIDGEGSICAYKVYEKRYDANHLRNASFRCCLSICNTRKELTEWVDEHFSNLNHSKKHQRTIYKDNSSLQKSGKKCRKWIYEWLVQGDRMVDILTQTLPYLVLKKEQAKLAIEFRKTFTEGRTFGKGRLLDSSVIEQREHILNQIRKLNSKGIERDRIENLETN